MTMRETAILVLFLAVFAFMAQAEDPVTVTTIDSAIEYLQSAVQNQGKNLATVTNQVNDVIGQFQATSGDIGRNFKKNKDQDKLLGDAGVRLQVLEDKVVILTTQMQELLKEGLLKPSASTRFREYQDYAKGLEHVNAGQFDKAIKEFTHFQQANPRSGFADYAQYWIGESYYMQADYPMAIKQYQALITKNSRSPKAPLALYRQGLSFFNLQSFNDAKAFFSKVLKLYPQTIEAIQASAQIQRIDKIEELKKQQELEMRSVQ